MADPLRLEFHAAAIPGTEGALRDELVELGFKSVRLNRGGIPFLGREREGWRACLESRIAQRIQMLVARFPAASEAALYAGVQTVDWSQYLGSGQTLAIRAVCNGSNLTHSGFVALKAKDAIVDAMRSQFGQRPNVDRDDPDLRIFLHLANDKAALYLDLSGEPLSRRGYRTEAGEAPLRETLAATLLRTSGWNRKAPLIDPCCGSGTIAIEAALWAGEIAPGINRGRFGFERWANFDDEKGHALRELTGELRRKSGRGGVKISAFDMDPDVIDIAKRNARAAGVRLSFDTRDLLDLQADDRKAVIVCNPPYGRRLELDDPFIDRFCAKVTSWHGWRVCMLSGSPEYERRISLHPKVSAPVKNGDIDCRILVYDVP